MAAAPDLPRGPARQADSRKADNRQADGRKADNREADGRKSDDREADGRKSDDRGLPRIQPPLLPWLFLPVKEDPQACS